MSDSQPSRVPPTSSRPVQPSARGEATVAGLRLAAIGDLHVSRGSEGTLSPLFERANEEADVLLLAGDLTDYGTLEEAKILVKELQGVRVPIVAVLGNHDHESGTPEIVRDTLLEASVHVLQGDSVVIGDIGIVGVKGFCGGFGRHTLGAWGEAMIKAFVQEAIDQTMALEAALARLRTPHRVALLHYAPIVDTVIGEPEAIFPFLGCSRLEEPLNRFPVDAVFHGHAHRGQPEGKTGQGVPVYNVALPLMRATQTHALPLRFVNLRPSAPRVLDSAQAALSL